MQALQNFDDDAVRAFTKATTLIEGRKGAIDSKDA